MKSSYSTWSLKTDLKSINICSENINVSFINGNKNLIPIVPHFRIQTCGTVATWQDALVMHLGGRCYVKQGFNCLNLNQISCAKISARFLGHLILVPGFNSVQNQ